MTMTDPNRGRISSDMLMLMLNRTRMWNQNRKHGSRPLLRAGVLLLAMILAVPRAAHAYTDPGSGALLWQAAVAGFVGFLFYARKLWYRIRPGDNPKQDTPPQREDE